MYDFKFEISLEDPHSHPGCKVNDLAFEEIPAFFDLIFFIFMDHHFPDFDHFKNYPNENNEENRLVTEGEKINPCSYYLTRIW